MYPNLSPPSKTSDSRTKAPKQRITCKLQVCSGNRQRLFDSALVMMEHGWMDGMNLRHVLPGHGLKFSTFQTDP